MSQTYHNGGHPSVEGWLDGQYEYIVPDKDVDKGTGASSHPPRDPYRDNTPERSDESSSRGRGHRWSREQQRSTAKERYTPASPPPEDVLERERDSHRHGSGRAYRRDGGYESDRGEHRPRYDKDAKYPPQADHGRPSRPPLNIASTTPHLAAGKPPGDGYAGGPRHRRYSQSSSPPRQHRGDKSSRTHQNRHHEDRSPSPPSPPHSSRKRDSHHGSAGHASPPSSSAKPHRPSLSHSQTAPYGKDPKNAGSSSRSFSFLSDPRFVTAAEAALQAGAAAAFSSAGGKWDTDKKAKVIRAGLGAAALSALKAPAPAESAAAPAPATAPVAMGPGESAGDRAGRYAAGHVGRKGGTKRRNH